MVRALAVSIPHETRGTNFISRWDIVPGAFAVGVAVFEIGIISRRHAWTTTPGYLELSAT